MMKLKTLKCIVISACTVAAICLLVVSAGVTALSGWILGCVAFAALVAALILWIIFGRCPYCGKFLWHMRGEYCPHCGNMMEE